MTLASIQNYFATNSNEWIFPVAIIVIGIIVIWLTNRYLHKVFHRISFDETLELFVQKMVKIFLWIVLIIILLSNLGFNVTGFIAGLGAAGIIIGFATKDIFSNLAAGLFILMNRPFKVNDLVEASGIKGTVKEISMSTCVIITQAKEYVVIPNSKIWGGPIKNLSRIKK